MARILIFMDTKSHRFMSHSYSEPSESVKAPLGVLRDNILWKTRHQRSIIRILTPCQVGELFSGQDITLIGCTMSCYLENGRILSAFRTRGVPGPTSKFVAACPYPDGLARDGTQGGNAARVISHQGGACSTGYKHSRERESEPVRFARPSVRPLA
jgi:hypothetical protein